MSQATALQQFSEASFDQTVLQNNRPTLVDFYADWCGPCRALGPTIQEIADELGDQANVGKVNVDDEAGLAGKYGISSIPTVLLFHNGKVAERFVGLQDKARYLEAVRSLANGS